MKIRPYLLISVNSRISYLQLFHHMYKTGAILLLCAALPVTTIKGNGVIEDTMVVKSKKYLYKHPSFDSKNEIRQLKRFDFVKTVDYTLIPEINGNGEFNFLKVKTAASDTGYIAVNFLLKLSQYRQYLDSVETFQKARQPDLNKMIGTTFCSDTVYPNEITINYPFKYVCSDKRICVIEAENKYNRNFRYLLLAENYKDCRKVLDIVSVNLDEFNKNIKTGFIACECIDSAGDCPKAVSFSYFSEGGKRSEIDFVPVKVWRPNPSIGKLEEIPTAVVKCRSLKSDDLTGP